MANPVNTIQRDRNLTDTLDVIVSDGTLDDVIESLKSDAVGLEAPATEAYHLACQLVLNAHDDAFKRVCELYFQSCKVWSGDALADLQGYGSGDDLIAGSLGFTVGAPSLYRCVSVDSPTASTWALFGSDQDLAGVLTVGNETGGTDLKVSNGDEIVGEDAGSISFDAVTGDVVVSTNMFVSGAQAGDALSSADDLILGDGTADRGITVYSGAASFGRVSFADAVGVAAGGVGYDHSTDYLAFVAGTTTVARVQSSGLVPHVDAVSQLGLSSQQWTSGWFSVGLNAPTITVTESASTPGGNPGAGKGKFWAEDTAPTTPKFTDDTNVERTLAYAVAPSYSRVSGSTARGSTNTRIYRWTTLAESAGSDITYTNSAAFGGSWTINTSGIYSISATQEVSGTTINVAIKVAAFSSNTFNETSIRANTSNGNESLSVAWTGYIASGQVVWIATSSTTNPFGSFPNCRGVSIVRVG